MLQGKVRKCFLGFVRRQAEKGDEAFLLSLCSQMPGCHYSGGVYAAPHRLVDIFPELTSGLHVILLILSPPWDNHCHCVVGFLSWFFSLGLMSNCGIYPGSGLYSSHFVRSPWVATLIPEVSSTACMQLPPTCRLFGPEH